MTIKVENNLYSKFKSYSKPKIEAVVENKKSQTNQIAPYIGSALGVGAAILANKKLPKTKYKTINDVSEMLLMAGGANVGGVLAGSVGADKKQQAKTTTKPATQTTRASKFSFARDEIAPFTCVSS